MASFGFAQQYQAPDYLTRSQAGLPVDPSMGDDQVSGLAANALAAPAPQRQPQQGGGLPDIPVSPLEAILAWAAHGGTPGEAAQNVRAVKLKNMMDQIGLQQAQQRFQLSQGLAPRDLLDYLTAPTEYAKSDAKNLEPQNVAAGNTVLFRGGPNAQGGSGFFAPKTDVSPSGVPYAITDTGFHPLGSQLPGKISVSPSGALVDDNRGLTGESVSIPNNINPGQTPGSFVPSLIGGKFPTVPAPAGGAAPPAPGAGAPAPGPRGIRNNNFGNVKALPNGQMWQGQTGVDGDAAVFANPADGIRAAATNLQSYAKDGVNTAAGIAARWAGANTPPKVIANYTHYISGALGVDPAQPLNLADPKVQQPLLKAIFSFENGPQAMAAWRGPTPAPAQSGGASAPATPAADTSSPGFHALGQPSRPTILSPAETKAAGYADGSVVERQPDGSTMVRQAPQYDSAWDRGQRDSFVGWEPVKQYTAIVKPSYEALIKNIGQMSGPAAYAILDTTIRTDNPGAITRQAQLDSFEHKFGLGASIMGQLLNYQGKGSIPRDIQQKIINSVVPFAQAHYDAAKSLYDAQVGIAQAHNRNPADLTVPIGDRPESMSLTVPPPQQRALGQYMTPKGPMKWDGKLWHPVP